MNKPASSSAPAIETIGLTQRFGDRLALDVVDLTVPAGTAYGFLGHNGAGKTTLIRSLLGLSMPTSGEMRILGQPVPAERRSALSRSRQSAAPRSPGSERSSRSPCSIRTYQGARTCASRRQCEDTMRRVGFPGRWSGSGSTPVR